MTMLIRPKFRETHLSFLSRIAALKGACGPEFCYDMGTRFRALTIQEPDALDKLQYWGGLSDEELAELISWSGSSAGNAQIEFRREILPAKAMRNAVLRGCPQCLFEDMEAADDPLEQLAIRGHWQFRETRICLRHAKQLVPLWDIRHPVERYDYGHNFREILQSLKQKALHAEDVDITPYDLWLDQRLENGKDKTFLADNPLYAAAYFCRLLGAELTQGNEDTAHQVGFSAASKGEASLLAAFEQLSRRATGALDEPSKAFGKLYTVLAFDLKTDVSFDPFRELLRRFILSNWQVSAGTCLLGRTLHERRLHSVTSFAKTCGIGPKLARSFLADAGIIDPDDQRPNNRILFEPDRAADLEALIPQLVGPQEMQTAIGATKAELRALKDEGVLAHRFPRLNLRNPWLITDGLVLLEELEALSSPVALDETVWETLQSPYKRKSLGVGETIAAIRNGTLDLGRHTGETGYKAFCVRKQDINALASMLIQKQPNTEKASGIQISKFGRSIGVRETGILKALFLNGHSPASIPAEPARQRHNPALTDEDVITFHQRFITSTILSRLTGLHRNSINARLKAANVQPFEDDECVFSGIYPRNKALDAFPEI